MRLLEQIVEMWNIISSEKNAIFKQLADLFNLSFMTGVFLSVIKTAKVFSVCKKDSKLDYSNYRPISRDCIIFF